MLGRQPKLIATMKKLFLIVAAMFAVVSFSACSDDDDNKDASIVGTWMIAHSEGWVIYSDGTRDDFNDDYPNDIDYYYWTYMFDDKGTCVRKSYTDHAEDDEHPDYFTYTINGKTLTLKESKGAFQNVFEIKSLTSQSLVLYEKGEKEDGEKYERTYTYKKI